MGKLNLDRVRANRAARKAKESRGDYWKCGPGVNRVRLALWESPVTGNEEYSREIGVHQERGQQPVICGKSPDRHGNSGESCSECDRAVLVKDQDGKEAAQGMWSRNRTVFIVIPLEKANKPFKNQRPYQFWAASTVASAIDGVLADCDEVENVRDYFGPDGLDFKITFNPKASPMEMYQVKVMPKVKCESLDPALFAKVAEMDLYAADNLEPPGFVPEAAPAAEAPADEPDEDEAEADEPEADEAPAKTPPKKAKAKPKGDPGKPNSDGFYDLANAQKYLAYYGFDAEGWRCAQEDGGEDAYFVSPAGDPVWEPPEPSAEQMASARGMTTRKGKRKGVPPADEAEDNADTE